VGDLAARTLAGRRRSTLRADPLGVFFALVASGLWIVTSIYSIGYMRGNGEQKQTRYFASFALSLSATVGVAFAANLLTFLLFYEMLTLATYPLVVHKETPEAIAGGSHVPGLRAHGRAGLHGGQSPGSGSGTGSMDFVAGGAIAPGAFSAGELKRSFLLFMAGVGVKAG
jgi:multicomponent Na+:H+ antiporter subunit D